MADAKISQLTGATTPLDGAEVLPIVQAGATRKVANNDLRPKQIQSNATSGVLQVAGPAAATTRVMTTPDANFTAARTDAAQTFTGLQTLNGGAQIPSGEKLLLGTTGFLAEVYYNANGNLSLSPRSGYDTQLDAGNLIVANGNGIDFSATPGTGTSELLADYEEGNWTPTILFGGSDASAVYAAQVGRYTVVGRQVTLNFYVTTSTQTTSTGVMAIGGLPFTANSTTNYAATGSLFLDNTSGALDQPACLYIAASGTTIGLVSGTGTNNAASLTDTSVKSNNLRVYGTITYFV